MRYTGAMDHTKMTLLPRTAYRSWQDQRHRCLYKGNPNYRWYGAKGIKVEYSSRDFVSWWLTEYKKRRFTGSRRVVVDRVDPSKNYTFGNIKLVTDKTNSRRVAIQKHRRKVIYLPTGRIFNSLTEAGKFWGFSGRGIGYHCTDKKSDAKFAYAEAPKRCERKTISRR